MEIEEVKIIILSIWILIFWLALIAAIGKIILDFFFKIRSAGWRFASKGRNKATW